MEISEQVYQVIWTTISLQDLPQHPSVNIIKSLQELNENNVQRHMVLCRLLLKLPNGKYHVSCRRDYLHSIEALR